MQIKVTQTKMHKIFDPSSLKLRYNKSPNEITGELLGGEKEVPVAEAKLVLIKCSINEALFYEQQEVLVKTAVRNTLIYNNVDNKWKRLYIDSSTLPKGRYVKPILISETEKIEVGDWYYFDGGEVKNLLQLKEPMTYTEERYKILALPEHFSPKHLQAIVDGKLKDGSIVLLECEEIP